MPFFIGIGLLVSKVSIIGGFVLLGWALVKATQPMPRRMPLQVELSAHPKSNAASKELAKIQAYAERLEALGADPALVKETIDEAHDILKRGGDTATALRVYRQSLPQLEDVAEAKSTLAERLRQEVDLLRATRQEMQGLS